MLEATPFYPRRLSSSEETGDEELSVLPRHTKVVVTGNNRTKSVLIGLHGVVKKAVGLGGWHWLVLKNGVEVKLQRNALSVLEAPTGQEDESESRLWNNSDAASEEFRKPLKPRFQHHGPNFTTCKPKSSCGSNLNDLESSSKSSSHEFPRVNFSKLDTGALWRYWKHFNLVEVGPNPSKKQLIDAVERHFIAQHQLDEIQVIAGFIQTAKRLKTAYC
eukprot:TRINITY_DN2539_c0_g1_i1.p1 TRINITY_DN2539_c0_g1~~TRINITY_DN2539_c0_g1_i1.p1  ORF type:complete len:218 (+),score=31.96 TRINITY_DN2539_c0_g1_i1:244-897(+)